VVSENIHTHPKEHFWKFQGGRGFHKQGKYEEKKNGISRRIAGSGGEEGELKLPLSRTMHSG